MEGAIAFYHLFAKSHYQGLKNLQAEPLKSDVLTHRVFIVCSMALTEAGESRVLSGQAQVLYYQGMDRK